MKQQKVKKILQRLKEILEVSTGKAFVYSSSIYDFHNLSFSQEGEDLILNRIFSHQKKGFYVDVGAHHPQRFSNTYLFYLKGWRGINIDAMPGSMMSFEHLRPEDTNIEAAISDSSEELIYFMFDEPALNGFSEEISKNRDQLTHYKIIDKKAIKTQKLSNILKNFLPSGTEIDFLSIDVEGLDMQVLFSNDWSLYQPKIILIEELSTSLRSISKETTTSRFLKEKGYEIFAKTYNTSIYKLCER